jgi:hypothetical protein
MTRQQLVDSIYEEIQRLTKAHTLLTNEPVTAGKVSRKSPQGPRKLSRAARLRISAAQKARWAKAHEQKEAEIKKRVTVSAKRSRTKTTNAA